MESTLLVVPSWARRSGAGPPQCRRRCIYYGIPSLNTFGNIRCCMCGVVPEGCAVHIGSRHLACPARPSRTAQRRSYNLVNRLNRKADTQLMKVLLSSAHQIVLAKVLARYLYATSTAGVSCSTCWGRVCGAFVALFCFRTESPL